MGNCTGRHMDDPATVLLDRLLARLARARFVGGHFHSLEANARLAPAGRSARGYALVLVGDGGAELVGAARLRAGDLALLHPAGGAMPALRGDSRLRGFWWGFHLGEPPAPGPALVLRETSCGHLSGLLAMGFAERRINDRWRSGRLAAILELVLGELRRRRHRRSRSGPRLSPAQCEAIETAAADAGPHQVDSADLARAAGLSRRYFTRLLRSTYGVPVRRWIMAQRLRRGANQLVFTRHSVAAIAAGLGYADSALFCRQFKALYGVSPLRHRRQPAHAQLDLWAMRRV